MNANEISRHKIHGAIGRVKTGCVATDWFLWRTRTLHTLGEILGAVSKGAER
jgi:hypothetical protein